MKKITLSEIGDFIKKGLSKKLSDDLINLRVRKESEFENCIYYHLREFLKNDEDWKIITSSFVKNSKQKKVPNRKKVKNRFCPDIILYEKFIPKIGIEIKWNRNKISEKDGNSLTQLIDKDLKQVYFITSVISPRKYKKLEKKNKAKELLEIPVNLNLSGADLKTWQKDRKKFREIGNT